MTVMGLAANGDVVLLVVEKSTRSRGITVAEAARLLRRRFEVRDAIVLGAAGDAQLATTAEGFLTVPLVADYARSAARRIPDDLLCDELKGQPAYARPVPCYVILRPMADSSVRLQSSRPCQRRPAYARAAIRPRQPRRATC